MITHNDAPNFSIVMPSGCNARCNFCFNKDKEDDFANLLNYVSGLINTLQKLDSRFYQISITGGEPLISPYFDFVMGIIKNYKQQFTNILITTNGTDLLKKVNVISGVVDHINISRHHYDQDVNKSIFGGTYNVNDDDLVNIIDEYSKHGIDISVNCVIDDGTTTGFIDNFIQWAKNIGFFAVRFRKENGDLGKTKAEEQYSHNKVLWTGKCPVCRTIKQLIKGVTVYWKCSILEPSDTITDSVFELVYDQNAKLYLDWNKTKEVVFKEALEQANTVVNKSFRNTNGNFSNTSSNSCGGSHSC